MFQEWNELNKNAQKLLDEFDFAKIKEIRAKQKQAEDSIFEFIKEYAPDDIKKLLTDDCGEMEVGYESEEKQFYFVCLILRMKTRKNLNLLLLLFTSIKK